MNFLKEAHGHVIDSLEHNRNVVLVAPTGYGKSKGVPFIQKELGIFRSVHSMPLRSLVQAQLEFLKGQGFNACHASGLTLPSKCPYMGGEHVVSTVDYLSLVLLRLPPAELGWILKHSLGHYEYPRANVFNSLLVFDEAHLLSEPWSKKPSRGRDFLYASLGVARDLELRTVVMTATLPESEIRGMKRALKADVVTVCKKCYGDYVKRVDDSVLSPKWKTETYDYDILEFVKKRLKEIEDETTKGKVLIVTNTVSKAMKVYDVLKYLNPVLVHGRLSEEDKKEAVKKIEDAKVVISTQVIEAGVDVDATWLITESAPVSSLAQRAGRLCRKRRCEEARVTILPSKEPYGEIATKTFERIKKTEKIEWRLLDDSESGVTFLKLINVLESSSGGHRLKNLYEYAISTPLPNIKGIKELLEEKLCSFVRDSALIEVRVNGERVEVSLDWLRWNKNRLKVRDVKAIIYGEELTEKSLGRHTFNKILSCSGYSSVLGKEGAFSLVVELDSSHYRKGYGLIV